jgi:hypothetical protein
MDFYTNEKHETNMDQTEDKAKDTENPKEAYGIDPDFKSPKAKSSLTERRDEIAIGTRSHNVKSMTHLGGEREGDKSASRISLGLGSKSNISSICHLEELSDNLQKQAYIVQKKSARESVKDK